MVLSSIPTLSRAEANTDKIHPNILAELDSNHSIPILIKLTEQLNPDEAALAGNASQITRSPNKKLVATLKAFAESSQRPLLDYLETAVKKSMADNVKSFYVVNMISANVHPSMVKILAGRRDVARIIPNSRIPLNKAICTEQHLQSEEPWNLEKIKATVAHDTGISGKGVVVGIIDTGIDWNHPDLTRRWRGANSSQTDAQTSWFDAVNGKTMPYDDDGHGTFIAGIIMGENGTGVAPGASWIAVKAFNNAGQANADWLLAAGEYMLAPLDANGQPCPELAPDIINNSWCYESGMDEWYRPMVQAWRAAGILPIFAAGNMPGPGSVQNPANYPESLAVAASDINNRRCLFSAEGPPPYPWLIKPDLIAPGKGIMTTKAGGGYAFISGTSAAAPHVTGVAALALSFKPSLGLSELEAVLKQSAWPLTDLQYPSRPNCGYGYGLVDAEKTISLLTGTAVIAGTVTTELPNALIPVIQHRPVTEYFTTGSLPIASQIEDRVGVAKAEVVLWDENLQIYARYPMELVEGNYKSGLWISWLPDTCLIFPSMRYSIEAVNRSRQSVSCGPYLALQKPGITPPYLEDFENYPSDWTWGGGWQWNNLSEQAYSQSVGKCFGTNPDYHDRGFSYLYSPPLDFRDATGNRLSFQHSYQFSPDDRGSVIVSDGEGSWHTVANLRGQCLDWNELVIDLGRWDDWPVPLKIIFALETNSGSSLWKIDRFRISGNGTTPQNTAANSYSKLREVSSANRLPLEATIKVVETGRTVYTGYKDGIFAGEFLMFHPATNGATFTLRVEAKGCHPQEIEFSLSPGETLNLDVTLEPREFAFHRLSGTDRYATAAAVCQKGWESANVVVLARGDNYADALTGVPLAHALNAPVLLTLPDALPDVIQNELIRLGTQKVLLLGGNSAISPSLEQVLVADMALEVERISGENRYDTAAEIARHLSRLTDIKYAVLAYSHDFPDALAAAPFSAVQGMPILLTNTKEIPDETAAILKDLKITDTLVTGGISVVGDEVLKSLPSPLRLGGSNRYDTAAMVASHFKPSSNKLYLATGLDFADSVCGAVLAARDSAAMLLVDKQLPNYVSDYILEHCTMELLILGGQTAVPEEIFNLIMDINPIP